MNRREGIFAVHFFIHSLVNMQIRTATQADAPNIAQLHAQSWQIHYRGVYSDAYLDHQVLDDRMAVWQQRLKTPAANQFILVAEQEQQLLGFACLFFDDNPVFGTLLDNLHVSKLYQGMGLGRQLIAASVKAILVHSPQVDGFYLWVLEENAPAIQFYERIGGIRHETKSDENPGGGFSNKYRYVWRGLEGWLLAH